MKKTFFKLALIPLAGLLISWGFLVKNTADFSGNFDDYSTEGMEFYFDVSLNYEDTETEFTAFPMPGRSYMGLREAVGFKESGGDYFVVNRYGYMGKYQFGKSTLNMLGIKDTELFLNTPEMQESAFKAYMSRNKWVLRRDIERYSGKYVNGILITESGILAAAHLAGPGNVKKYLRSGGEELFSDAFGTSVHHYMKRFSGYDTSHIIAKKNAKV